jgi:hypothetical protein
MSRWAEDGPEPAQKGHGPAGPFRPAQGVSVAVQPTL